MSLTRTGTRGGLWMVATGGASMVASLVAQVALGWLLSDQDFGVYALAIGVSSYLLVFKNGGVRMLLVREDREGFDRMLGDAFWLSVAFSVLIALALAALSPVVGHVYDEPRVTMLILVIAIALPLSAYPGVALTGLQVDLRFATLARIEMSSAILRYTIMVTLAVLGLGPLSFVLPVIAVNIFESIACALATHLRPWRAGFSWDGSRALLGGVKWPMTGSVAGAVFRQSDYVALGLVATTGVVGVYFFAYQLSIKLSSLFSESVRKVVVPVFAAAASQPERQRAAVVRGSAFFGVIATPVLLLLTVTASPLESIVWRGRWEIAVPAIQILAAVLPIQVLVRFVEMITLSLGQFRLWAAVLTVRGVGLAGAALLSGAVGGADDPTIVAIVIGLYLLVSGLIEAIILAKRGELPIGAMFAVMLPPYLYAVGVAVVLVLVSRQWSSLHVAADLVLVAAVYALAIVAGTAVFFRSARRQVTPVLRHLPGWGALARVRRE